MGIRSRVGRTPALLGRGGGGRVVCHPAASVLLEIAYRRWPEGVHGAVPSPSLEGQKGGDRRAAWLLLLDNLADFPTAVVAADHPDDAPAVVFAEAETDDPQRQPPALSNLGYPISHFAAIFPAGSIYLNGGDDDDGSDESGGTSEPALVYRYPNNKP